MSHEPQGFSCWSRLGGVVACVPKVVPEEEPVICLTVSRGDTLREAELSVQDAASLGAALSDLATWLLEGPFGRGDE